MCILTLGLKFTYKGTPNDDLQTVTSIFKKIMFEKYSGCKDLQEILIYFCGISKVNKHLICANTRNKLFYWFN